MGTTIHSCSVAFLGNCIETLPTLCDAACTARQYFLMSDEVRFFYAVDRGASTAEGSAALAINSAAHPLLEPTLTDAESMVSGSSSSSWKSKAGHFFRRWVRSLRPPPIQWLPTYSWKWIPGDLVAGVTVGVMAVPQGMAYAALAGVSPVVGLWTAFIASWCYTLLGSSKDLIVGPVAILSLVTGEYVRKWGGEADPTHLASLLAFGSGLVLAVVALLRLGFIVRLMSRAVITGFTAAAALVICFAQLKAALGAPFPAIYTIIDFFRYVIQFAAQTNGWTALVSGSSLAFLLVLKALSLRWKWMKWVPGPLLVVVTSTIVSWQVQLVTEHVAIVGPLPTGWPIPLVPTGGSLPSDSGFVTDTTKTVLLAALLGAVEHMSIGLTFAYKNGYSAQFSGDAELWALGVCQFVSSWFSGYAPTGSFTRTAVNAASGSRTPLAGFVCGIIVMFAFLFLSPALSFLPQAALAAIVISGLIGLFDFPEIKLIWAASKLDFLVASVTFLATLLLGVEAGVMIGVGFQILLLVFQESSSLNALAIEQHADSFHVSLPPCTLSFLNAADVVSKLETASRERSPGQQLCVSIDFSLVQRVDSSAAVLLRRARESSPQTDEWIISGAKSAVIAVLRSVLSDSVTFEPSRRPSPTLT